MNIGKLWCTLLRKVGNGRHKYRNGLCVRCGLAKRKAKGAAA